MKKRILLVMIMIFSLLVCGCGKEEKKENVKKEKPELIIYCGITMVKPMTEIAKIVEQDKDCSIIITKDGSGTLLKMIEKSQQGDLFLPGSDYYIQQSKEKNFIKDTVWVGYNKAAIIVPKGNPKNITNDLMELTDGRYRVVLANPDSGSIGQEAKKVLERRGIDINQLAKKIYFTNDSKDNTNAIKSGEADATINWYATATWAENEGKLDAIAIDEKYAPKDKLILALLTFSKHPEISTYFMEYANSSKGREIFKKHGFISEGDQE